jgi:hypothetical protein
VHNVTCARSSIGGQVPWDYYAFRNGSKVRVLADIPPFGYAFDGAWIAHYYTKVREPLRVTVHYLSYV